MSAMIDALEADGPFPGHADKLHLFGRLVGSWDITGTFFDRDGTVRKQQTGEWHFGWVLEGRAIQDVLITPPRDGRELGHPSNEYGTTIRAYDPTIDGWRVTFVAPVSGASVSLIAREHGDEIWLEGRGPDNSLFRWTFSEITPRARPVAGVRLHGRGPDLVQGRGDHPAPPGVGEIPRLPVARRSSYTPTSTLTTAVLSDLGKVPTLPSRGSGRDDRRATPARTCPVP